MSKIVIFNYMTFLSAFKFAVSLEILYDRVFDDEYPFPKSIAYLDR